MQRQAYSLLDDAKKPGLLIAPSENRFALPAAGIKTGAGFFAAPVVSAPAPITTLPAKVKPARLQSNGKLLSDLQIAELRLSLAKAPIGSRHSKKLCMGYGIIKGKNSLYAIYNDGPQKQVEIGSGTYGAVKVIQNLETGKWHALKTIKRYMESAVAEHAFLTYLNRTNQEPIIFRDSKKDGTQKANIILDYEDAPNLYTYLMANTLSDRDLLDLVKLILEAYFELISKKILHCDIKLANILYNPKIKKITFIDFGTATLFEDENIAVQTSYLSSYSAPEVLATKSHSQKSEVFAIGVMLDFILRNRNHVTDDKTYRLISVHSIANRKEPSFADNVSCTTFIERMLDPNPEKRPSMDNVFARFHPKLKYPIDFKKRVDSLKSSLISYILDKEAKHIKGSMCSRFCSFFTNSNAKLIAARKLLLLTQKRISVKFTGEDIAMLREKGSKLAGITAAIENLNILSQPIAADLVVVRHTAMRMTKGSFI